MSSDNTDIDKWGDEILADSDYDTELGKRMAVDARRVADEEMTRAEFQAKYAEDVGSEFGVKFRPAEKRDGTGSEPLPRVPDVSGDPSRRTVLKTTGALAGTAALAGMSGCTGSTASAASDDAAEQAAVDDAEQSAVDETGEGTRHGMVLDTERCIKCLQCVDACKEENHTPEGHFWMRVFRYQRDDREYEDETECESLQRPCMHCTDAPCVEVCPNNSRFFEENGRVLCDYDTCLGCKYCEIACPYHVNAFVYHDPPGDMGPFDGQKRDDQGRWVAGTPPHGSCSKCTFCVHREWDEETRGTTACEEICPADAIHFGDLNDPESDPNVHLDKFDDDEVFQLREDASDPNVYYVGENPNEVEVEAVPGPTTHADMGLEEPNPSH